MDTRTIIYYLFHVFGFIATVIFTLFYYKKFGIPLKKVLIFILSVYPLAYAFMWFQFWVESGFTAWGNNIVRTFIWVPLIGLPFAKLYKLDYGKSMELLAPIPCVIHGVAHFGCVVQGCCHGYPWEYGIWNPELKVNTFPIQIIEAVTAILIVVAVVLLVRAHNYDGKSNAYPIMLVLFGSTRFIYEFFRDNVKLFWGISNLAIHAFVMFVVGLVWLIVAFILKRKKEKQQPVEQVDASVEEQEKVNE